MLPFIPLVLSLSLQYSIYSLPETQENIVDQNEPKLTTSQMKNRINIVEKYDVDSSLVEDVILYADKHSYDSFPTANDLLAIVGIESGWNHKAKSGLKSDPAVGLTQIRSNVWKTLIPKNALHDVENQIKYAAKILNMQYVLTKNKEAAIIAYNVGYGSWLNGNYNSSFLNKFKRERARLH